jgi:hypothetical protein
MVPGGRLMALADLSRQSGVPAAIERELRFPYTTGARWIADVKDREGLDTINSMLADPPATTAVILHPERGVRWEPDRPALDEIADELGSGWERQSGGSFGEFQWMNLMQTELPGLDSATSAAAWRGDRYAIYVNGESAVATFVANAGPGLFAGLTRWLNEAADTEEIPGGLRAEFSDGRTASLTATKDGLRLVLATDEASAQAAVVALGRE